MENLSFEEMKHIVGGTDTSRLPSNPGTVTLPFPTNDLEE